MRHLLMVALMLLTVSMACEDGDDQDTSQIGHEGEGEGEGEGGEGEGEGEGSEREGEGEGGEGEGGEGEGEGEGGEGEGGEGEGEDPAAQACHESAHDWDSAWAAFEDQVLVLTNEQRAQGANCGSEGSFGPAGAVTMEPHIRCAARVHSMDMGVRDYADHNSPGGPLGDDPWERMANAGFTGTPVSENIAFGYTTPAQVVLGWLESDGHCANMMNPTATQIGIGYANVPGSEWTHYWTENFGK